MNAYCCLKSWRGGIRREQREVDHFHAMCLNSGEAWLAAGGERRVLHSGDIAYLPYGSSWDLGTERGFSCLAVTVRDPIPGVYAGEARALRITPDIEALLNVAEAELRCADNRATELIQHLALALAELLIRLSREHAGAGVPQAVYWTARVKAAIRANLHSTCGVEELLAELPLSNRQRRRHFTATLGMSPKAWQTRCRMEEARRLLREGEMAVGDVALELGYSTLQHFSDAFTREVGMAPSAYRRG